MENVHKLITGVNEEYIKTYRYYSSSTKSKEGGDVEKSLIVTTKRVVLEEQSTTGFYRDEFPIEYIDKLDTRFYHSKKSKIWLFFVLLGVALVTLGFTTGGILSGLFPSAKYVFIGVGFLSFLYGLLYLIYKKSKQAFSLTLSSINEFHGFADISGENFTSKPKRVKKGTKKVQIKSKVTPSAVVMLNELNALLIDIKDFNMQIEYAKKMMIENKYKLEEYGSLYNSLLEKISNKYK